MEPRKFPRRREVRQQLEEMFDLLASHLDSEYSDHGEYLGTFFDRPFLTAIRDLMREGVRLDEALACIAYEERQSAGEPEPDEDFDDLPGLRHYPEFQG